MFSPLTGKSGGNVKKTTTTGMINTTAMLTAQPSIAGNLK
jgi:hypothetical protein